MVTVIHDDAFPIDPGRNLSIALELSVFDKTDALEFGDPRIRSFYSAQNMVVAEGVRKMSIRKN
ncbi:MAG TPA: hypothetical protein PK022_08055 [Syntrophales bacterium]|nr:hypothetical protein [Syntrophales bacterium]